MVFPKSGFWLLLGVMLLLAVGCEEGPTPTAVLVSDTPEVHPTTPKPETPIPDTPVLLVTPNEQASTPNLPTVTKTAVPIRTPFYTAAELQATIIAKRPDAFVTLEIEGNLAFIVRGYELEILDISDRERPIQLSTLRTDALIKRIQVFDETAYLVLEFQVADGKQITIQAVDVSDPESPVLQGAYTPDFLGIDAAIIDGIAHIVGYGPTWGMVDVSSPNNLTWMGTVLEEQSRDCPRPIGAVKVAGGYLHLFTINCRFPSLYASVYDVSSPFDPQIIQLLVGFRDIAYHDNYIFGLNGGAMQVYDISNWAEPELLGNLFLSGIEGYRISGSLMAVRGYIYHAYTDGLRIVEQVEPTKIEIVNHLYTDIYISDMREAEGFVYLLDWDNGLIILDASDPAEPVELGRWLE